MKIVIDIPENVYKYLKQEWVKVPEDDSVINQIMHGILHGIVLPKGHGDLIGRNTVQMSAEKFHSLGDLHTAQWVVDNAPAVIPADK